MSEMKLKDSNGRMLTVPQAVEEMRLFMDERPDASYKIIIGSDSRGSNTIATDFVTAIVIHRVGNGGRYFYRSLGNVGVYSLRDRIIKEVAFSLETALEVVDLLRERPTVVFDFEVHVDVGENGKTNTLIAEVTGMVRAHNFVFKTKPESYAASCVADKHV